MTAQSLNSRSDLPLLVAGSGLAGLTAAIYLARAGQRVVLLEQAEHAGGRAASRQIEDWTFNLGPHALYRAAAGMPILHELGIRPQGRTPAVHGLHAFRQARPVSLARLLASLSLGDKARLAMLFAGLFRLRPAEYAHQSTAQWLAGIKSEPVRQLIGLLTRVATYVADFEALSAEVAIQQLQYGLKGNVLYLDGGWQGLIDSLLVQARAAGVEIRLGCGLKALDRQGQSWRVTPTRGEAFEARGVILALPPQTVQKLLQPWPELALQQQLRELRPVQAACLDVGLRTVPAPRSVAAFGLDEPSYLSLHSASARLAPTQGGMLHAAWYLDAPESPELLRSRLEARIESLQPGWREQAGPVFFYPHLTVTQALATAASGGLAGRPALDSGLPDLYLAGDWVGPTGWLADAALASAKAAAAVLLAQPVKRAHKVAV